MLSFIYKYIRISILVQFLIILTIGELCSQTVEELKFESTQYKKYKKNLGYHHFYTSESENKVIKPILIYLSEDRVKFGSSSFYITSPIYIVKDELFEIYSFRIDDSYYCIIYVKNNKVVVIEVICPIDKIKFQKNI